MNHLSVQELLAQSIQPQLIVPIEQSRPLISLPSRPVDFTDVHTFDYSYRDSVAPIVALTNAQKHQILSTFMTQMTNMIAIQGVNIIIANIGHDANRDTTNQKNAEDIMVVLAQHCMNNDPSIIPLLEEQLQDMVQLGQCAQGRTTRLWQLYVALGLG